MNKFLVVMIVVLSMFLMAFDYPVWDKSSISVSGQCLENGIAQFSITNTGEPGGGDMQGPVQWRFFVDGNLVDVGELQLNGGETLIMTFGPYPGSKVILEVDQRPGHPGNSEPRADLTCGNYTAETPTIIPTQPEDPTITPDPIITLDPTITPEVTETTPQTTITIEPTPQEENTSTPSPLIPYTGGKNNYGLIVLVVVGGILLLLGIFGRG